MGKCENPIIGTSVLNPFLIEFSSIELNRIEVVFSVNVIGLIPINSCILFDGLLAFITFCDHSLGQKDTRTMNTF